MHRGESGKLPTSSYWLTTQQPTRRPRRVLCRQLCTGESGSVPNEPGREGAGRKRHFKASRLRGCAGSGVCACCRATAQYSHAHHDGVKTGNITAQ